MSKYYCPYCPPRYFYQKQRDDGVMICGQCGDPLVKTSFFKPKQVLAIISIIAFLSPLAILVIDFILNLNSSNKPKNMINLSLVSVSKDYNPLLDKYHN